MNSDVYDKGYFKLNLLALSTKKTLNLLAIYFMRIDFTIFKINMPLIIYFRRVLLLLLNKFCDS